MITSTTITKIGNSKGIRIPSVILESLNLKENDCVNIEIKNGQIIIKPISSVREGWNESFKRMHKNGDDKLLDIPNLENDIW